MAYADLSGQFLEAGGYECLHRTERVAVDFGFAPEDLIHPLDSFPGGERQLLKLASAFVQRYDLYLLDEPTTHLDYQSVELLEKMLRELGGTVLFTSHDRYLSQRVAERNITLGR